MKGSFSRFSSSSSGHTTLSPFATPSPFYLSFPPSPHVDESVPMQVDPASPEPWVRQGSPMPFQSSPVSRVRPNVGASTAGAPLYPLGYQTHSFIQEVEEEPEVTSTATTAFLSNLDLTRTKRRALEATEHKWRSDEERIRENQLPTPKTSQPASSDHDQPSSLRIVLKRSSISSGIPSSGKRKRPMSSPSLSQRRCRQRVNLGVSASPTPSVQQDSCIESDPAINTELSIERSNFKKWLSDGSTFASVFSSPLLRSSTHRAVNPSQFSPDRLPNVRDHLARRLVPLEMAVSAIRSSSTIPDEFGSLESSPDASIIPSLTPSAADTEASSQPGPSTVPDVLLDVSSPASSNLSSLSPTPEPMSESEENVVSIQSASPVSTRSRSQYDGARRTFLNRIEIRDEFQAMYRKCRAKSKVQLTLSRCTKLFLFSSVMVPSVLPSEVCKHLDLPVPRPPAPLSSRAKFNPLPRGVMDLYTPRWVQGQGLLVRGFICVRTKGSGLT